jgi:flagellar motor protein MotB
MGCTIRLDADKPVTIKAGESKSIDNYKLELLAESPEPVKAVAKKSAGGYRLPPKVVAVTMLILAVIALFAFIALSRSRAKLKLIQQELDTQKKLWAEKLQANNQDYETQKTTWEEKFLDYETQKKMWEDKYSAAKRKADSELREFGERDIKKFTLSGDELFEPGSAEVKPAATEKVKSIAEQIKQNYMDCVVLVTGYTDTLPLLRPQTISKFKDNWNLGAQRALAVVRILQAEGIPGRKLSAISRGQFHPLQTEAESRRVEIVLRFSAEPQQTSALPADANKPTAR